MNWADVIAWAEHSRANTAAFYAMFLPACGLVLVGVTAIVERWWPR